MVSIATHLTPTSSSFESSITSGKIKVAQNSLLKNAYREKRKEICK